MALIFDIFDFAEWISYCFAAICYGSLHVGISIKIGANAEYNMQRIIFAPLFYYMNMNHEILWLNFHPHSLTNQP